jgi:hypothetical protein
MTIHADETVITNMGKIPLRAITKTMELDTPSGMQRVRGYLFTHYTGIFCRFFIEKLKFVTSADHLVFKDNNQKVEARSIKIGDKIKFKKGFLTVDNLILIKGFANMVRLVSYDVDGYYYLANGLLVTN